jgi:hypothetical protein
VWRSLLLRELHITHIDDKNRWLNFDTNTKYDLALFTLPWRSIYMEILKQQLNHERLVTARRKEIEQVKYGALTNKVLRGDKLVQLSQRGMDAIKELVQKARDGSHSAPSYGWHPTAVQHMINTNSTNEVNADLLEEFEEAAENLRQSRAFAKLYHTKLQKRSVKIDKLKAKIDRIDQRIAAANKLI